MKMQFLPENPAIGVHQAKLVAITVTKGQYGNDALKWVFEIVGGESDGCVITRMTGTYPKLGEALAKTVAECLGRELKRNESLEVEDLIGREYTVTVGVSTKGEGVTLQSIKPAK